MNGWERGATKPRAYSILIISLLWGQNLYVVVLNFVFAVLCVAGFGNLPGDMVCYHVVLDVNIFYSILLPVVDFILLKWLIISDSLSIIIFIGPPVTLFCQST